MARWGKSALMMSAAAIAVAVSSPAWAQTKPFNLPAQDAVQGIPAFARQAGVQILVSEAAVQGKRTARVQGAYTVDGGLTRLLAGTGLEVASNDGRTITLRALSPTTGGEAPAPAASTSVGEVTVTGTHIRGIPATAPTIQITAQDLKDAGYTSIGRVFAELPQNFNEISADQFNAGGGANTSNVANGNFDRAVGVDLRGLGADSTLTLLNGTRRAGSANGRIVDISIIPLAIIDRVDVVSGGHSAVYGSDAVGGVVNFVTKQDFDGAETDVAGGGASYGGERAEVTQVFGAKSSSGGFVAAYDFTREWPTDLVRAGLVAQPTPNGSTQQTLQAIGDQTRHTGYLAGHYAFSQAFDVFGDALYSHNDSGLFQSAQYPGAASQSFTSDPISGDQYSLALGAHVSLSGGWLGTITGTASGVDNHLGAQVHTDFGPFVLEESEANRRISTNQGVNVVFEGPLPELLGRAPRLAVGAEFEHEHLSTRDKTSLTLFGTTSDVSQQPFDRGRDVSSAFGELSLPLTAPGSRLGRLELSIAGRYDHYSDVGGTTNPQVGILWESPADLTFRASYSTSFRAPALVELQSASSAGIFSVPDPNNGGQTPVLFWEGGNPVLKPETATTWTASVDYAPRFAPWLKATISYFDIDFRGRIDAPSQSTERSAALVNASEFGDLINRSPTASDIARILAATGTADNQTGSAWTPNPALPDQGLLAAFPNLVVFDSRTTNIAVEKVQGLDFLVRAAFDWADSQWKFGVNATYTPQHTRNLTPTSPAFDRLNQPGFPDNFRLRATGDWSRGPFGALVALNHTDGYSNPFSTPANISASTTVDLDLRYRAPDDGPRALRGLAADLSFENLFDQKPPRFLNPFTGVLYDPSNAFAIGRYVSVRVTKHW